MAYSQQVSILAEDAIKAAIKDYKQKYDEINILDRI